ncbi:DUF3592 domain-containing protein [uncultured Microscilla sp.]|uniref:DUF3592 domain-containing protein n=1 Tax=uncultured Microscilla sp. TaxID=432653 RepID=UPI002633E53D|nr:DUF3592 domain-containing protein [uncultured Microscilla sp.]
MNELLIIFLVGVVPCLIVGVWQTSVGYLVISRALQSKTWQKTNGVLTASIESTADEVDFSAVVPLKIAYRVDGQIYHCRKVNLYENWKKQAQAAQQLQSKDFVPVYYNPKNHQEAVIEKGLKPVYWLPVALGISSLVMAMAGVYYLVF